MQTKGNWNVNIPQINNNNKITRVTKKCLKNVKIFNIFFKICEFGKD